MTFVLFGLMKKRNQKDMCQNLIDLTPTLNLFINLVKRMYQSEKQSFGGVL